MIELIFWTVMMIGLLLLLCIGSAICNVIVWFADRRRRPMATVRRGA